MAHVVGVPKRDPCQKCKLPVFLAERLTVGKKVYHRTCLKCARCGSQLTPGSFYETEVDDEYCCETCPDEEDTHMGAEVAVDGVILRNASPDEASAAPFPPPVRTVRSSIAERLAFFEQSKGNGEATTSKLLQKSLSDEEKRKSLQRIENATSPYKMSPALSSFLNDTVDGDPGARELDSEPTSSVEGKSETQMETSDTEDETGCDLSLDQTLPELPKTVPPVVETDKYAESPTKKFTSTAQLQLVLESNNEIPAAESQRVGDARDFVDNISTETAKKTKHEVRFDLNTTIIDEIATTTTNDNANNNGYQEVKAETESSHKLSENSLEVKLELSETNDNDCITKDKTADAAASVNSATSELKAELLELQHESSTDIDEESVKMRAEPSAKDVETIERLSVVRARLQQFEVIANNNNINDNPTRSPEKVGLSINDNENIMLSEQVKTEKKHDAEIRKSLEVFEPESVPLVEENKQDETKLIAMEVDADIVNQTNISENVTGSLTEVPMKLEMKDGESIERQVDAEKYQVTTFTSLGENDSADVLVAKVSPKKALDEYPEDLNPFKSDDEEGGEVAEKMENLQQSGKVTPQPRTFYTSTAANTPKSAEKVQSLNPFDSSDDEIELEKSRNSTGVTTPLRVPPPRPPPPRISRNPFGEDTDEDDNFSRRSSLSSSFTKKTPVPTPRTNLSQTASLNPTPEATPRLSSKSPDTHSYTRSQVLQDSSDYYGSTNSLTPQSLQRNSVFHGSNNSLSSTTSSIIRARKSRKAPAPPPPPTAVTSPPVKELFPAGASDAHNDGSSSKASTPSSSTMGTPKSARKKRPAPAPPKPARLDAGFNLENETHTAAPKNLLSYPLQSEFDSKLSDEEKALLEGKKRQQQLLLEGNKGEIGGGRRLIPLDASILEDDGDMGKCDDFKHKQQLEEESGVVYRRVLIPPHLDTPIRDSSSLIGEVRPHFDPKVTHDRQLEKMKDNKEAQNRNRQSQVSGSSGAEDSDATALYNKSSHGKWKRRKGPAPALPIPPRKVLQMLPLQEIRQELEIIEVQQQGLEKQGVVLEKMIRDRCEGGEIATDVGKSLTEAPQVQNSKEVEELILQLFELVNEKNELFRRQAELMYLRRQHRLEQEQADLEYEIRVLMAQPECNKTDSDKAREEALIARLVEVVKLRNDVIDCLEMDRLREAEEDLSIKQRLELHSSRRSSSSDERKKGTAKLSKKEKKKQKEAKKNGKCKKLDADKDADETELNAEKTKVKKRKKKFLII